MQFTKSTGLNSKYKMKYQNDYIFGSQVERAVNVKFKILLFPFDANVSDVIEKWHFNFSLCYNGWYKKTTDNRNVL